MRLQHLSCDPSRPAQAAEALQVVLRDQHWVQLIGPGGERSQVPEDILPSGPGLLLSGGGSSGRRRLCLHPVAHFDQSARATAVWLAGIGIAAAEVQMFNPLPVHHVSGLMPWWRSRCWGASHVWLLPPLMRDIPTLVCYCERQMDWGGRPAVLSLVPTQLMRLMADPIGINWLQHFAVIWVGGAALPSALADQARQHGLCLSPCYGATETAAMVTALSPQRFLEGEVGCGDALVGEGRQPEESRVYPSEPFHWHEAFPKVFRRGGFHAVVGNPPFRNSVENRMAPSASHKRWWRARWPRFSAGSADQSRLFWARTLHDLLGPGGRYGMISPTALLSDAGEWQAWMFECWRPDHLWLQPVDQFPGARIRTTTIIGGQGVCASVRVQDRE